MRLLVAQAVVGLALVAACARPRALLEPLEPVVTEHDFVLSSRAHVYRLPLGPSDYSTNCYVLWGEGFTEAVVVDPGYAPERVRAFLEQRRLTLRLIVHTHNHGDHVGATTELQRDPGATVLRHPAGDGLNRWFDGYEPAGEVVDLADGQRVESAGLDILVTHLPGHSPGGVGLYVDEAALLSGDTLFKGSVGRTDFPGGDLDLLFESLSRIATLPPETLVLPGHEGETTVGQELRTNPWMEGMGG